ncbi:MAG: ATP-binding protein [Duodenibacillus sp.]|nr:ATP-binding protein [Duodenibacillus sp.]
MLICGATGTGKTWLAAVLGQQACLSGYQTQYIRYCWRTLKLTHFGRKKLTRPFIPIFTLARTYKSVPSTFK